MVAAAPRVPARYRKACAPAQALERGSQDGSFSWQPICGERGRRRGIACVARQVQRFPIRAGASHGCFEILFSPV